MAKYNGPLNGVMLEEKKDAMSDGLTSKKTDFRVADALDHVDAPSNALRAEFAYKGTDKGVQQ